METSEIYLSLFGKIPNLQEYLATCRKYMISIVPIFQSFSQIVKVYGKEDANSIIANCDATVFLGGIDAETLKIIQQRLGKETVKSQSRSENSGKGKGGSISTQLNGRDIMSLSQLEQMNNSECIVLIRAIKPFKVKKFNLNSHPNYKYTAEADPKGHSFINPFYCEFNDEEIESIRIKKMDEAGYIEPGVVTNARFKAAKEKERADRRELALSLQKAAPSYARFDENADYGSPREKNQARQGHEDYIETLGTVYSEARNDNDTLSMDIIRNTCLRYNIDLGYDFNSDIDSNISSSHQIINNDEDYDYEESHEYDEMRFMNESEVIEAMKNTHISPIIGGPTSEFDIPTLEQVVDTLGGFVTSENNSEFEEKKKELLAKKKESEAIINETPKDVEVQEDLIDLEVDEQNDLSSIEPDDEVENEKEDVENYNDSVQTSEVSQVEEPNISEGESEEISDEDVIPTEEEMLSVLEDEIDFSDTDESELMDDVTSSESFDEEDGEFFCIISSEEIESLANEELATLDDNPESVQIVQENKEDNPISIQTEEITDVKKEESQEENSEEIIDETKEIKDEEPELNVIEDEVIEEPKELSSQREQQEIDNIIKEEEKQETKQEESSNSKSRQSLFVVYEDDEDDDEDFLF